MASDLVWNTWGVERGIPDNVPIDELLLVEIESSRERREYRSARFFTNRQGQKHGVVGDSFYFDRKILRWASIEHLVQE